MGVSSCRGLVTPNLQRPLVAKLRISFRAGKTCLRSSINMPSLVGLGFHLPPGRPKTLSFLLAALRVQHNALVFKLLRGRF